MFVGALPKRLASYIAEGLRIKGEAVLIGCSGAFTVERALIGSGLSVSSNDVSLFSSAIGCAVTNLDGEPIASPREAWLEPFCQTPEGLATSLLVLSGNYDHADRVNAEARRQALYAQFPCLHAKTREKLVPVLSGLRGIIRDYTFGDIEEHYAEREGEFVRCAFMPTYVGGYEKLWGPIEDLFEWQRPSVPDLTDDRRQSIMQQMAKAGSYVVVDDSLERGDASGLRLSTLYHRPGKRTMFLFSDFLPSSVMTETKSVNDEVVKLAPSFDPSESIGLTLLTSKQAGYVRRLLTGLGVGKLALSRRGGICNMGVVTHAGLIGAFGLSANDKGAKSVMGSGGGYLLYDLARGGLHRRLSKLVVMLTCSKEAMLTAAVVLKREKFGSIETTAFTDKPVSMKYRGVMKLLKRSPGALQYQGVVGELGVEETVQLWRSKYVK